MPFPPMPTQVACPQCQTRFVVPILTVIDVGEQPELKEQFLRGQVNYARCPQCGTGGVLSTPLIYHDPAKELLVTYVPAELGMTADQQEQFIGSLVTALMNNLPAEQRKAYFFQPKTALTLDSLYDTILEAEGVSKEALEKQRAQLKLVNTLLAAVDDDKTLDQLVEEHRQELDYGFYLLLSDLIDAQTQEGNEERAARFQTLRTKLLERASPVLPKAAPAEAGPDELIELLLKTEPDDAWRTTVALNRRRLDYSFFQALTAKIEAAEQKGDTATAQKLTDLRQRILNEIEAQDRIVRQAEDKASLLIMRLAEAPDLQAALREHLNELDEVFLNVLARYQKMAEDQKDTTRAEKFAAMLEAALNLLEEQLPPDVRLINKLLRADYPDGTNAVLEEYRGLLNDAFLATYDKYVASLGQRTNRELAEHLKQVRAQITAKMTILRA